MFITIDADNSTQRIDNFLFRKLKNTPKSHLYKLLRKGLIRVNKKRCKPDYHLQANDVIRMPPSMQIDEEAVQKPGTNLTTTLENSVIYEDDNLIVINKPSGIAAHGGSGISFGAIEIMRAAKPKLKNLELVHRLDRETSGCMIFAKKRSILRELHELIRQGKIEKNYLVLVRGKWEGGKRKINESLVKNVLQSGERMVQVSEEGKESITTFTPLKVFDEYSLLEAKLGTGRTHQIRVHAAHINHPIAGDEKYGDKEFNAKMREKGLKRLFLHACRLRFTLPSAKETTLIEAPLSDELKKVISNKIFPNSHSDH